MSSDRMSKYKNRGRGAEEMRTRRRDNTIELRKNKKEEQLTKRRNVGLDETDNIISPVKENGHEQPPPVQLNEETMKKIVDDLFCNEPERQFIGAQTARKVLSRERNPPIEAIINAGIVPRCVEFLARDENPDLQFEAAWVLTNIASGTSQQTAVVVQAGAVPAFIKMLNSSTTHIAEQATWALGNIAGDGPHLRDLVISSGIVPPLAYLAKQPQMTHTFLRNVAWTLSNLCRTKNPPPPMEATSQCLPALSHLIKTQDMEVIADACWALSYLSDGPNEKIEQVVKAGVVARLVALLHCNQVQVITPCLRAVGNIVTGNDSQTQAVLKAGVLPALIHLFQNYSNKPNIVKEAAWTVSNIAAGSIEQVNMVVHSGIVLHLMEVLKNGDIRAKKEAIWAVTNITSGGTVDHMSYLVKFGMIETFCSNLTIKDWKSIVVILDGLENVLKAAQEVNQLERITLAIEECGGLDKIEQLQNHENNTVYEKAYTLVDQYFSDPNEEDEDSNIAPVIQDGQSQIPFSVSQPEDEKFDF